MFLLMTKGLFFPFIIIISACCLTAASTSAPTLDWVKTISGSGATVVAGVATDLHGNLYISGTTTSLDFPTVAAAQPNAGGSPLLRINPNSGAIQKVYATGLATAASIAVDPRNPRNLYATSSSGLLRSTDGGNTWKILPGFPAVNSLNSVIVDPANSDILYAATSPLGVLKSVDGGASWAAMSNGIPASSNQTLNIYDQIQNVSSINVTQIWIDPKSPGRLLAAFQPGLVRSTNAGASWTVSSLPSITSIVFDPFTQGTFYAAGPAFIKSTGDGETWTALSPLPDQSNPNVIAADPFHQGTLYGGSSSGLFESTDSGATWTLRIKGTTTLISTDPSTAAVYAFVVGVGIVRSADGFNTYSLLIPASSALAQIQVNQIQVAGSFVFVVTPPSTDVFVTKLDSDGNLVYSTYFGGSGSDASAGIAVGNDGSVYVTGTTGSTDFPVTKGAYAAAGATFVFKLNPNGSLAWSSYFPNVAVVSIAVDANGSPYMGGQTGSGLPTTPGAYETQFQSTFSCPFVDAHFCIPPTQSGFLTKFNPEGSALVFSTYISQDNNKIPIQLIKAIAVAPSGNVYIADNGSGSINPSGGGVYLMNSTGAAMLASNISEGAAINSIALDAGGNLYATGSSGPLTTTPGAFQSTVPAIPYLSGNIYGPGVPAFVLKFNSALSKVLAATYLGGERLDVGLSVAIDQSGDVIVGGYTYSKAFPVRAPFQESFSPTSGFIAELDSNLSQLLFSTYLGDTRPFFVQGAVPDSDGNVLLAGSTEATGASFLLGYASPIPQVTIANKIALHPAPAVRLDSVVNYASQTAVALSPGEAIAATGAGFSSDSKLLLNGKPLAAVSASASQIVAIVPNDTPTSGAIEVSVSSNGSTSNSVYLPAAAAAPGIYSADGSGYGQGYILNADGTRNSQSNPATPGSAITLFVNGVGPFSQADGFAVLDQTVAVFVAGFYANGIAAVMKQVPGLPGSVYEIGVYIPTVAQLASQNPDLKNFMYPPEVEVMIDVGASASQSGIGLWVK